MALVSVPPFVWGPYATSAGPDNVTSPLGAATTMTFDAASDALAFVFQAESTTVPDQISFYVSTVTTAGTAGAIEARLENIDANGAPSGAVLNSATGSATVSTTGRKIISGMDGTAAVTAGDFYCISLTAGAGWDRNLAIAIVGGAISAGVQGGSCYHATNNGGAGWVLAASNSYGYQVGIWDAAGAALKQPGLMGPYASINITNFTDASNPDEKGNRLVPAAPMRMIGVSLLSNAGAADVGEDHYFALYTGHTTSPVLVASQGIIDIRAGSGASIRMRRFPPTTLSAGTTYALTMKHAGTTNIGLLDWTFDSNADIAHPMMSTWYSTTRDGGAGAPASGGNVFTDSDSVIYGLWPVIDQIDDGVGGGVRARINGLL